MTQPNIITCPDGLTVGPDTAHLHEPLCPLDRRSLEDRVAQAVGDPGSILERLPRMGLVSEALNRWQTRAVMAVLDADKDRGLLRIADGPALATPFTKHPSCVVRKANADGVTFRCATGTFEHGAPHPGRCNFVAERRPTGGAS